MACGETTLTRSNYDIQITDLYRESQQIMNNEKIHLQSASAHLHFFLYL